MPTATKEKTESIADRLVRERAQLTDAAEELCMRAAAGEELDYDQRAVFQALAWDKRRIENEIGRCKGVLRWQQQAGNPKALVDARAALEAARQKAASDKPDLERQIQVLQRQAAALDQAVVSATKSVETIETAVGALRKLVPVHLRERHDALTQRVFKQFHEVARLESRLSTVNGVLALRYIELADHDGIRLHCGSLPAGHPCKPIATELDARRNAVSDGNWQQYQLELAAEREELLPALEQLRSEKAAAQAECDKLLDFYWR